MISVVQTSTLFHLWPRLHHEILRFLEVVPRGDLKARADGFAMDLGTTFRHIAEVEDYYRRLVLERDAPYRPLDPGEHADAAALRARLQTVFAATERLLEASLVEALRERPVTTRYPARNALEALMVCQLHTVHHRAELAGQLRALGADPGDWL